MKTDVSQGKWLEDEVALFAAVERALVWLDRGDIGRYEAVPWGSNYTFLSAVRHNGAEHLAIYKPRAGEGPLWDFPPGTLYRRECAAFVIARSLAWPIVPPTVVRDGPLGTGSLQLYVAADPKNNYFSFREDRSPDLRRLALFDLIVNNADRKAGHCLLDANGHLWAIDHGLTFHAEPKLRTVIWDFVGEDIPQPLLEAVSIVHADLKPGTSLHGRLRQLLSAAEIQALSNRVSTILRHPVFPTPGPGRPVPWPPV